MTKTFTAGSVTVGLHEEVPARAKQDPGYDMPDILYVVTVVVRGYACVSRQVYHDYPSALMMFEEEVVFNATQVAKKALRVAA